MSLLEPQSTQMSSGIEMKFCAMCGKELDDDARFCSRCGASTDATMYGGFTEKIEVDYPQSDSVKLELIVGAAGSIELEPGAGKFVEGTIEYEASEWKPLVTTIGDTVKIEQHQELHTYIHTNLLNRWSLKIGDTKPFNLDIRNGVGRATWNLSGLPITGIYLRAGAGVNSISFKKPNPSVMRSIEVQAGAGELEMLGLLDANLEQMKVRGGVGKIDLDFSGEKLQRSAYVNVGSGVGSLSITVREGTPARAQVRGISSVQYGGFYRSRGSFGDSEYKTNTYDGATDPKLEFNLELGIGGVKLRTIP